MCIHKCAYQKDLSVRPSEQPTGGQLDFVYNTDMIGLTYWTKTANSSVGTDKWDWADAYQKFSW